MYLKIEYNRLKSAFLDYQILFGVAMMLNIFIAVLMKERSFDPYIAIYITLLLCKDCFNGRSIGKRKYHYQVIDERTNSVASPLQCWIRNFTFIFFHLIEIFVLLSNPHNKTLGELITHTKVDKYTEARNEYTLKTKLEGIFIIVLTLILIYVTIIPFFNWLFSVK